MKIGKKFTGGWRCLINVFFLPKSFLVKISTLEINSLEIFNLKKKNKKKMKIDIKIFA